MPKKYVTRQTLVIVESPAKCKKIEEYLGPGYKCIASFGHLRQLPSLENINVEQHFQPTYTLIDEPLKKKQIELIKKEIKKVDEVVLACDADREGEAICFHLCEIFHLSLEKTKRIVFHEITESAIQHAIRNPRTIDMNLVQAQQARQILDVLVGFQLSPLLWKYITQKAQHSLSAGRCQTPALKLIYENQQEINQSEAKKVYQTTGYFTNLNLPFSLNKEYETEEEVTDFLSGSITFQQSSTYSCGKPVKHLTPPPEPLITSTLQQKASNELHTSPKETMKLCQKLYESGHITYMRTDSKVYSKEFVDSARQYICKTYDESYLYEKMDTLVSSRETSEKKESREKDALIQEAHEAIRPTQISLCELPETFEKKEKRMYQLIWEHTLESCMASSLSYSITAKIAAFQKNVFNYASEQIDFPGWKVVSKKYNKDSKDYQYLQTITEGQMMKYKKILSKVTLKNNKMHYTEARLVQLLEEKGIGRPSTFSAIIDKIQERGYVKKEDVPGKTMVCKDFELESVQLEKDDSLYEIETTRTFGNEKNKLVIQPIGIIVMEFLEKHFSRLFHYNYTKQMEEDLDNISKGNKIWYTLCEECNQQICEQREKLVENQEKKLEINIDEEHTYMIGKYGPVIKYTPIMTNTSKERSVEFKPVKKDIDLKKLEKGEYTLEDIIDSAQVKKQQCVVGSYEGEDVIIKKGKYGLYMMWGTNTKNLKEFGNRPAESIRWEEIQKYLESGVTGCGGGSHIIREISDHMTIRKGERGDYIFYKSPKMKKPKFFSLQNFKEDYKTCSKDTLKQWINETYF